MMTTKTNFHTHTQRCGHADGTEEDYVRSAVESGLSVLGFSDHAPYPDHDFGTRMPFGAFREHLETVDMIAMRYKDQITIRKGVEIEYLAGYRAYYEELLEKWGIEYLLLGEHFYVGPDGELVNVYGRSLSTGHAIGYARTIAEGMHTGLYSAVAHPDLFMINPVGWDDDCRRAADIIIDAAIATDTILEYNANGLRRGLKEFPDGLRYPYPHHAFWEMAAQAHVRTIVGSDCHNPANVWDDAVRQAYEDLRALGIDPVMTL